MKRVPAAIFGALLVAATQAFAAGQTIAGDVVKVDGASVEVRSASGELVHVRIPDNARISGRAPSDVGKITQGSFVGTTAVAQPDGTLLAREVHIFPESMRGTGEGHRPWPGESGSTMTNATVASVGAAAGEKSAMANATVSQLSGDGAALKMTLHYNGGEKTVLVPRNVPVVTVEPADRSQLVPGAHVIVYASVQAEGTLVADRVSIGMKGSVPPL